MQKLLEKAFLLASELHRNQIRKVSIVPGVPYISHLMEVSGMVLANGGSEVEGAAALLHDALEDQGRETAFRILDRCGQEVLSLVLECTEEGTGGGVKPSWMSCKLSYLSHIETASIGALRISVADKLQSAREVQRQVIRYGDNAYTEFSEKDYATIAERKVAVLWFHDRLVGSYTWRLERLKSSKNETLPGIEVLLTEFTTIVSWLQEN